MKAFLSKIADFFLDKTDNGDEKRFFGNVFLVIAAIFIFTHPDNIGGFSVIAGFGAGLLGIAAFTDGINPPTTPTGQA